MHQVSVKNIFDIHLDNTKLLEPTLQTYLQKIIHHWENKFSGAKFEETFSSIN